MSQAAQVPSFLLATGGKYLLFPDRFAEGANSVRLSAGVICWMECQVPTSIYFSHQTASRKHPTAALVWRLFAACPPGCGDISSLKICYPLVLESLLKNPLQLSWVSLGPLRSQLRFLLQTCMTLITHYFSDSDCRGYSITFQIFCDRFACSC